MTTSIRIQLPIAPGAKTCEGCPHHRWTLRDVCALYRDDNGDPTDLDTTLAGSHPRLPECLAAERVKVGEYWRVNGECSLGPFSFTCGTREYARYSAKCRRAQGNSNVSIVHVTRYGRARP